MQIGDVVILNSGGPLMTVIEVDESNQEMRATWYNEEANLNGGTRHWVDTAKFPMACVKPPTPAIVSGNL